MAVALANPHPAAGVEPARPDDEAWVKPLLRAQQELYGGGDISWRRYWRAVKGGHQRACAEYWDVVRPFGFCHWRFRKDGSRAVDELVVAGVARHMGVGSRLLRSVGRPVEIHILPGDAQASGFLRASGLQPLAKVPSRRGPRVVFRGD